MVCVRVLGFQVDVVLRGAGSRAGCSAAGAFRRDEVRVGYDFLDEQDVAQSRHRFGERASDSRGTFCNAQVDFRNSKTAFFRSMILTKHKSSSP